MADRPNEPDDSDSFAARAQRWTVHPSWNEPSSASASESRDDGTRDYDCNCALARGVGTSHHYNCNVTRRPTWLFNARDGLSGDTWERLLTASRHLEQIESQEGLICEAQDIRGALLALSTGESGGKPTIKPDLTVRQPMPGDGSGDPAEILERACAEISRLCAGRGGKTSTGLVGRSWTMSVPVQADDSDMVFSDLLNLARRLHRASPTLSLSVDAETRAALVHSLEAVVDAARSYAEYTLQDEDDAARLRRDADTVASHAAALRAGGATDG